MKTILFTGKTRRSPIPAGSTKNEFRKISISRFAAATLTISCILAVSVANAQGAPTAEELHAQAFSMAGPKLELRDDGLVYKKGGRKPYSGTIEKGNGEEMRYADGVLERIVSDRKSDQVRQKQIYIDGYRIMRQIEYGENNAPSADQVLIDNHPFGFLILRKNGNPTGTAIPETTTLRIDKSGAVSTHWYDNGQMSSSLRYVNGKCCLATGWHRNGQKSHEQKYVDGIAEGAPRVWDADGNDELKKADPVVGSELIQTRDGLDYLGYSMELFTGQVVSSPNPLIPSAPFEYSVVDGKKHGTETRWYRKDRIRYQDEWSDGVVLSRVLWHATGEKDREFIYPTHPGFIEKLEMTDSSEPAVAREDLVSLVKGYESHVISWHRNGQIRSERTLIKTGKNKSAEHGLVIHWNDNGQKNNEAIYRHGLVKSKTIWRSDGQKHCEVFRDAITQPLQYRAWDDQGNELEPMTFAEASREFRSNSGYGYACNVHKKQLGYKVKFVQ